MYEGQNSSFLNIFFLSLACSLKGSKNSFVRVMTAMSSDLFESLVG